MRLSSVCRLFLKFSASTFVDEKLLTSALTYSSLKSIETSRLRSLRSAKSCRHQCVNERVG